MKRFTGQLLIGIGVLDTFVGVLRGHRQLAAIARAGFFNAVEPEEKRIAVFWFVFSGFALLVLGHVCFWLEQKLRRPVPAFVGWELLLRRPPARCSCLLLVFVWSLQRPCMSWWVRGASQTPTLGK